MVDVLVVVMELLVLLMRGVVMSPWPIGVRGRPGEVGGRLMALVGAVPGRDEELKEFDIISEKIGRRNFVVSNVYVCALKTIIGERVKKRGEHIVSQGC